MSDTDEIRWKSVLGPLLRANSLWYYAGRQGEGRMVLSDKVIPNAKVQGLSGASLTRCDLSRLQSRLMEDVELTDCILDDGGFTESTWGRSKLRGCRFHRAWMGRSTFEDAHLDAIDWRTAYLAAASWTRANVTNAAFDGAFLVDAMFEESTFTRCSFWVANLSRQETFLPPLGKMTNTRFVECDFRNATITGMQMEGVTFERCRFHGILGAPAPGFDVTLIEPDYAATPDTKHLIDPEVMLAQWRAGETFRLPRD